MKIKRILIATAAVAAIAIALIIWMVSRPGARPQARNLLLITLDTMRADRLGCYGDRLARTPALDALARDGVLFENAYTPVPLTLPAHCSLLTGRWPLAHGVRVNGSYKLPAEEQTLAEALKAAGFDTAALVATYVLKRKFGLDQGFDLYDDQLGEQENLADINAEIAADGVYAKFGAWLEREHEKPFFLWLHFYDPHMPYTPPAEYLPAVAGDGYRGEVAYMDHFIGRVVSDLKQRGLWDSTLVVVAGDHGEGFGEHDEKGHGIFCYEESVRVPLILAGPGLGAKPSRLGQRARLIDAMPTVLELLGVGWGGRVQGESLAPLMAGKVEKTPRPVYLESLHGWEQNNWAPLTALISGPFKYISLPQAELYDLGSDPEEKNNLFFKKNLQARAIDKELAAFVGAHLPRQSTGARSVLQAEDRKKLAALGYISGFAAGGQASIDPKVGIGFQNRYSELKAALDRGETAWAESGALRLLADTQDLKLPFAYVLLNHVYEKQRRWDKVEANLRQACEVFQDSPVQALTFRGNLMEFCLAKGDLAGAEAMAELILSADPAQVRVLEVQGEIREKRGDWAGALASYREALKSEPDSVVLAKKAIQMRLRAGDRRGALADSEALLRTAAGASDSDLHFTAAMLAVEAGDSARAEALLRQRTELKPAAASSWFDYALVLGRNGRRAEARAAMAKALALVPSDLDAERRQAAARALRAWQEAGR